MLYNCPNGSVLNMSTEYYFTISDRELEEMCSCNDTSDINDPFYDSNISRRKSESSEDDSDLEDFLPEKD